ncbi:MAG TPA: right-handed parallel beta-helix repeat-containing protein [Steroidobacteraceae bacterium]|nr:right-handed parallel beta-helix repeat-containing protein [Steroidobacteraceae bacterium]
MSGGSSGGSTANLYVSPNGNDSSSCTSSAPCKTINRAASLSVAGNVISVAAGTYGGFTISRSGTSSAPITYKANGTVTVSNSGGYGIYINNASYVVIDGFTVTNTGSKGIAARGATPTSPMRGLVIKNNSVSNTQEEGMYLSEVASSLVENNVITDVGLEGVETTGHGIYLANAGSKNTIIRGNTLQAKSNTWGQAIHMNGDVSVGGDGVITGLTIENNWILGGFNNGLSMDGVQSSDIRNNVIVNTAHHGIRAYQIDGAAGPKGLRIVNNTINAPKGNAVKTTEDAGASVVFNNILVGRDGATSFESSSSTSNNVTTWAVNSDYSPQTAAIGKGITSYAGVTAPSKDIDGRARQTPYDVGAVAH